MGSARLSWRVFSDQSTSSRSCQTSSLRDSVCTFSLDGRCFGLRTMGFLGLKRDLEQLGVCVCVGVCVGVWVGARCELCALKRVSPFTQPVHVDVDTEGLSSNESSRRPRKTRYFLLRPKWRDRTVVFVWLSSARTKLPYRKWLAHGALDVGGYPPFSSCPEHDGQHHVLGKHRFGNDP